MNMELVQVGELLILLVMLIMITVPLRETIIELDLLLLMEIPLSLNGGK